jgi:hypothetical protein
VNCDKHDRNYVTPDRCQDCLIDELAAMTKERDDLKHDLDYCGTPKEINEIRQQTAARCAVIAISYHIGSDSTSPARIAGAIRKEFNL